MKKFALVLFLALIAFTQETEGKLLSYHSVNINYFYYELSPYGEWIELEGDLLVWRPVRVNYSWSPYSIGRWEWTSYGWYWDSYEPFGWITYHYGRWIYDDYYGWIWIPDYEWAPAWVEWRYDDLYIGWAPLPPYASFSINVGIYFSVNWHHDYYHWHFVDYRRFCSDRVYDYYISANHVHRFFTRTKYRTNYAYRDGRIVNRGIDRKFVERRAGRRIRTRDIVFTNARNSKNIGHRNSVIRVYEPDERTIKNYGRIEREKIKRAERTSLIRDKITASILVTNPKGRPSRYDEGSNRIEKNYVPDKIVNRKRIERENSRGNKRNEAKNRSWKRGNSKILENIRAKNENIRRTKHSGRVKNVKPKKEEPTKKIIPHVKPSWTTWQKKEKKNKYKSTTRSVVSKNKLTNRENRKLTISKPTQRNNRKKVNTQSNRTVRRKKSVKMR